MKHCSKIVSAISAVSFMIFLSGGVGFAQLYPTNEIIRKRDHDKRIDVLKIDVGGDFEIVTSVVPDGEVETLKELIDRVGGIAGVNGVFFRPDEAAYAKYGQAKTTVSERIFKGDAKSYSRYRPDTGIRGVFGFTRDGEPLLANYNSGNMGTYYSNVNSGRLGEIYYGLGNFPVLLESGVDVSGYFWEQINGDPKMTASMKRNFICTTADKKTVYVGFVGNFTLFDLPAYLQKSFDCARALSLDAGKSVALYHDEQYLLGPGRKVMDAFVIVPKEGLVSYTQKKRAAEESLISGYQFTSQESQLIPQIVLALQQNISKKRTATLQAALKQKYLNQLRDLELSRSLRDNARARKILRSLLNNLK
ncbi:MAG TPA: phosphodiester glycosidase family protein [Candidatus Absconditabacterales bacterium]|nr:phosphodiester glycosidase family protein [Candidatus Absconditabacterales bacterium]